MEMSISILGVFVMLTSQSLEVFKMVMWTNVGKGRFPNTSIKSLTELIREMREKYLKGTTTIGITCADGIVLATDRRVTAGYYIAHKHGKKIYIVDSHVAVTVAGAVADAQRLVDSLRVEAKLYKYEEERPISIRSLATLASNMLFNSRPFILIVHMLLGGVDEVEGAVLYNVDWFGTITKELYTATGSGYPVAIGILEENYRKEMTTDEAIPLAVKAVRSAIMRDTGTGEGVDVAVVTKEGAKILSDSEVKEIMKKV